jgi:hypothetical protein
MDALEVIERGPYKIKCVLWSKFIDFTKKLLKWNYCSVTDESPFYGLSHQQRADIITVFWETDPENLDPKNLEHGYIIKKLELMFWFSEDTRDIKLIEKLVPRSVTKKIYEEELCREFDYDRVLDSEKYRGKDFYWDWKVLLLVKNHGFRLPFHKMAKLVQNIEDEEVKRAMIDEYCEGEVDKLTVFITAARKGDFIVFTYHHRGFFDLLRGFISRRMTYDPEKKRFMERKECEGKFKGIVNDTNSIFVSFLTSSKVDRSQTMILFLKIRDIDDKILRSVGKNIKNYKTGYLCEFWKKRYFHCLMTKKLINTSICLSRSGISKDVRKIILSELKIELNFELRKSIVDMINLRNFVLLNGW